MADLVYPPFCVSCKCPLFWQENKIICKECLDGLERIGLDSCWYCATPLGKYSSRQKECNECRGRKHSFTRVVSACRYNDIARELIHAYKFNNCKSISPLLSELLYRKYMQEYSDIKFNYILPVPLHKRKQCERGYNQSALIAQQLAKMTGLTHSEAILSRVRYTTSQSLLNSTDRELNLSGAFDVNKPLNKSTLLLVDDVFTTGSTINECAHTLRRFGANRVYAIVFAR